MNVAVRLGLRSLVVVYLLGLLVLPVSMVFFRAFDQGVDAAWTAISQPNAVHALKLTLLATVIATVVNTVFGIACAMLLVRRRPWGSSLINAIIDLPFAVSPVVVGLALLLTFGQTGWFGEWFIERGFPIIFSTPGIVLATVFVTLPFVVREVVPVLEEVGDDQEQAAATLGASPWTSFWRITLPSIRWGVAYGVVLTVARALGEYGAVAVVSGKIIGSTETMTVYIRNRSEGFGPIAEVEVYASALVLAALAILVLAVMTAFGSRAHRQQQEVK
jgi:sulfate transport system permease protein